MSQLLAMSFDHAASPSITLKAVAHNDENRHQPFGWGFAWYPAGDYAALVIKDPTSIGDNAMTKVLRDWDRFHATVFICHIRGAAQRRTQEDTHPFGRSYAGRDWIIAQSGDLNGDLARELPLGDDPVFEPVGHTDTEWAFCWLLTQIRDRGARRLADVGWDVVRIWFQKLNGMGTANFVFSDGQDLLVYHDTAQFNGLHWIRRRPPHVTVKLEDDVIDLDLGDAMDINRTGVIFASRPLSDEPWRPMQGGQMVIVRRGAVIWDSHVGVVPAPAEVPIAAGADAAAGGAESGSGSATATATATAPAPPMAQVASSQSRERASGAAVAAATVVPPSRTTGRWSTRPRVLTVFHRTEYRYAKAVEHSTHVYRLRPIHDVGQTVLEHSLEITAEGYRREYEDVFGNMVTRLDIETPFSEMIITARSIVRFPPGRRNNLTAHRSRFTIPLLWMPWQRQMMQAYLLPPELPETQLRELSDYAMSFVERNDYDLAETLADMNRTIYRDFAYIPGSTNIETTPFDVYVSRRGVCQDFANLLICMARLLNIPARYMVGYIYTGGNYENKVQSDASHAWVEVYLPQVGWRGFDPTNGCLASNDHVRVAFGRNYRDATPTGGTIFAGGGGETLRVDVKLEERPDLALDESCA